MNMNHTSDIGPKHVPWSWRDTVILLSLTLIVIPVIIETWTARFLLRFIENEVYAGTITGFIMAIVFICLTYLFCIRKHQLTWNAIGVRGFQPRFIWHIVLGILMILTFSVLALYVLDLLGIAYQNQRTEDVQQNLSPLTITLALISAVVISPIYEEIFYRGVLYSFFRTKLGIAPGLILNGIIFTLVHIPHYETLPIMFAGGVVFAWLYEKSSSIIPAVLAHTLLNLIGVTLSFLV